MESIRIAAVGDVMCGESFYQYGRGPRSQFDRFGADFFDPEIGAFLRSHDLVFANLECVLSDAGYNRRSLRSHQMRGRPHVASFLKHWGITVTNLANNHILEHGGAAAAETAANLQAAVIAVIGAGSAGRFEPGLQVFETSVRDLRVAALGACLLSEKYAFNGGVPAAELPNAVRALAARNDVAIVSLHWGTEYMPYPSADQRALAHNLIECGATLVLGHHPHVVQGVQQTGRGLTAYSLGNFVFDQLPGDTRWGGILSVNLDPRNGSTWKMIPTVLDTAHRPRIAVGKQADVLAMEFARRQRLVRDVGLPPAWQYDTEAERRNRDARSVLHHFLARTLPRLPMRVALQTLARPLVRRAGYW